MGDYDDEDDPTIATNKYNVLPVWGNEKSMNLNSLILSNIQGSPYFKVKLFGLKTYHEVIDEIYYQVSHVEPWEAGSRKVGGQTGMCGGVRGVGAGGIVSSAFCLLYKLFTLKLTRKQLTGMLDHCDSPYIRCLGFMYARYTLPPADLWDWFKDYLADEEEVDVKAGGGLVMYMGDVVRDFLLKLDWFGALFPRIPVPIQKIIVANMKEYGPSIKEQYQEEALKAEQDKVQAEREEREARVKQRYEADRTRKDQRRDDHRESDREPRGRHGGSSRGKDYDSRGKDRDRYRESRTSDRSHRDKDRRRKDDDFSKELKKAKDRVKDERRNDKKRSRSRERKKRSRSQERRRSRSRERSKEKSHRNRRSRS